MTEIDDLEYKYFAGYELSVWRVNWSCGDGCCSDSYSAGKVTKDGFTIVAENESRLYTNELMKRLEEDLIGYIKDQAKVQPSEAFKEQCIRAYQFNQNMTEEHKLLWGVSYRLYRAFNGYSKYTKSQQYALAESKSFGIDCGYDYYHVLRMMHSRQVQL